MAVVASRTTNPLLLGVLLLQLMLLHAHPSWTWLDHPAIRWTARISYASYLWHGYAIGAARHVPLPWPAQLVIGYGLMLLVSEASWRLIEQPALRLKRRLGAEAVRGPVLAAGAAEG
jgi:peptidoglycan/LPS O-acetylase OafA/YrhL